VQKYLARRAHTTANVAVIQPRKPKDLGQAIRDAQRECESEKEKIKFDRMLEDHKK